MGKTTELFLSRLCEKTFFKLWSYPNVFKKQGDELCDLFSVFDNHIFIFQEKEIKFNEDKDFQVAWERWKRTAVEKQIKQLNKAKNWVLQNPNEIYLDAKCQNKLLNCFDKKDLSVHKILVAHGAKEACKYFSDENIYGSLAVSYGDKSKCFDFPFSVHLDKNDPVHVFDSHNLEIILDELDTFYDFSSYLSEKEKAISQLDSLMYCGEEDLLANYWLNFDKKDNKHFIGTSDKSINGVFIGEGAWKDFISSKAYNRKKQADKISYFWDEIIQRTCQHSIDGELLGNSQDIHSQSAIHEMAKEPRFSRRALSEAMIKAIENFPENAESITRNLSFMPSFYKDKGYVFLQLWHPNVIDYDNEYRPKRQKMLEIACGCAKNKFPDLNKIIGIAIDAPKHSETNSEDFILMNCEEWPEEQKKYYEEENKLFGFFGSSTLKSQKKRTSEFPQSSPPLKRKKVGRNDKCPCNSGKKYKKCCGS